MVSLSLACGATSKTLPKAYFRTLRKSLWDCQWRQQQDCGVPMAAATRLWRANGGSNKTVACIFRQIESCILWDPDGIWAWE
jgi:hypothetical protein